LLFSPPDELLLTLYRGTSSSDDIADLKLRNDVSESAVENLINLPHLHEPAILFSLQLRYTRDEIYTYTGPILIAVNPFKRLQLYTQETLQIYYNSGLLRSQGVDVGSPLPPHVYAIADAAYRDMMNVVHGYGASSKGKGAVAANQSILISGESGAGKTESTKIVLRYLTTVGNSNTGSDNFEGSIMDKVLQSNPILEAFGNAKTLRNDNSSRFGKFIELEFSKRGFLIGGSISTYLLEKVRLPWQQFGERNFHIFYQLTSGASEEEKMKWKLKSIREYEYTTKGSVFTLDGVDDSKEFHDLKVAMTTLNFSQEDQTALFEIVAGILHLGQLKFQSVVDAEGEGSKVSNDSECMNSLELFSSLCGLSVEDVVYTLSVRVISARGESYVKKLTPVQASDARDALAKAIYGKIFDWIVSTINRSIKVENGEVRATIGVLDIFGFECFTSNSFEQLCINYTNETLQQQFNQYIFKLEQQEYQKEKIEWSFIEFPDNKDCLELIEHKLNGILAMLDDECRLPMSSDEKFAGRMYKAYAGNARFSATAAQKRNFKFSVHHYAGPVEYSTFTFVDKNKDELPKEASNLLSASSLPLLKSLFDPASSPDLLLSKYDKLSYGESSSKAQQPKNTSTISTLNSVGTQFKEQLHRLMDSIYATCPHYIRCLKPNDKNQKDNFNRLRITEQLRYGGVLEAVRVARSGFPVRLIHAEFFTRYRMLTSIHRALVSQLPRFLSTAQHKISGQMREVCEQFLNELWQTYFSDMIPDYCATKYVKIFSGKRNLARQNVQVGLTKIFLRKEAHDVLESLRFKVLFLAATQIQAYYRRFVLRNQFMCIILATRLLQRVTRGMFARSAARSIRCYKAAVKIQSVMTMFSAQQKFLRFKYSLIKLQASFRKVKAVRFYRQIRRFRAAVKLQSFYRSKLSQRRYLRFRWGVVILQNRLRKTRSIKLLKKLKIEAKDLGKLQQNNENLKKEIDEIKLKAAQERERLREDAEHRAKELAAKLKQEEEEKSRVIMAQLTAKLEAEQKLREEAEVKLKEAAAAAAAAAASAVVVKYEEPTSCSNCEDMTLRYQDALKKIVELEQLLERERAEIRQKERSFLKENTLKTPLNTRRASLETNPRGMGIAFIPVKEPGSVTPPQSTSGLDISSPNPAPELQNEYNKLRHANHVLEQEVSRLRKLSLEQQTLLETRARTSSRDSPSIISDTSNNVRRNSGRLKAEQMKPHVPQTPAAIVQPPSTSTQLEVKSPSWNQAWDSEDDSSESESTTDQGLSSHSNSALATAAVTQTYEKNLESWKNEFYNGFKIKFWEVRLINCSFHLFHVCYIASILYQC
jgi:myosin-5